MVDDVPTDVRTVLQQLFEASREALATGDTETCLQTVSSAESVAANKLPDSELRERILHGCERIRVLLAESETTAAVEYLEAMERLFQ